MEAEVQEQTFVEPDLPVDQMEARKGFVSNSKVNKIRASRVPVYFKCSGASLEPVGLDGVGFAVGAPADIGTAVHGLLEDHVMGRDLDYRAAAAECMDTEVEESDLRRMVQSGIRMLSELALGETLLVEEPLRTQDGRVTGHVDIASADDEVVHVIDYKTSQKHSPLYWYQMHTYALLLLERFPKAVEFHLHLLYVRIGETQTKVVSAKDVSDFRLRLYKRLDREPVFKVGSHCGWCDNSPYCSALKRAVESMSDIGRSFELAKAAEAYARSTLSKIKEYLKAHGEIPIGDEVLGLKTVVKKIVPKDAAVLEQLVREYGLDAILGCASLSKEGLRNYFSSQILKNKGAAWKLEEERLLESGLLKERIEYHFTRKEAKNG